MLEGLDAFLSIVVIVALIGVALSGLLSWLKIRLKLPRIKVPHFLVYYWMELLARIRIEGWFWVAKVYRAELLNTATYLADLRIPSFSTNTDPPAVPLEEPKTVAEIGVIATSMATATTSEVQTLRRALSKLPELVTWGDVIANPAPGSKYSFPIGVDSFGNFVWWDFCKEVLHLGLYGTTNSGKDTAMMGWFVAITTTCTPQDVLFAVLDGKGHWLTPNLAHLKHMMFPPAGGFGTKGYARVQQAIRLVESEAERRETLIFGKGYRKWDDYVRDFPQELPMVVVIITDGLDVIQGEIETFLISMVSKARALGFRVIVSMQTPTRRDQRWRMNLPAVLCGPMQDRSQDSPALGLAEASIVFRPSLLPPATYRQGTFVARVQGQQLLVQTPLVTDEMFDAHITTLPVHKYEEGHEHTQNSAPPLSPLEEFLRDRVIDMPGATLPASELYAAYEEWLQDPDLLPTPVSFGIAVSKLERFVKQRNPRGFVEYKNIAFAEED